MPRCCERCDEGVCTCVYYGSSHHGTDVLAHDNGGDGGGGVHFISMAHTVERMRSLMVMVGGSGGGKGSVGEWDVQGGTTVDT